MALCVAAMLHQWHGEATRCPERSEPALALASEQVLPFFAAIAIVLAGWALVKRPKWKRGFPAALRAPALSEASRQSPWAALARSPRRGVPCGRPDRGRAFGRSGGACRDRADRSPLLRGGAQPARGGSPSRFCTPR